MTLTDRYLAAIGRRLPKDQADDIVAELRDVLLTRREAKEAELGRALDRRDEEAMVKDFGHPLVVAARYGQQTYLIGPEVYPFFVYTLKLVLTIVCAALITAGVASIVVADGDPGNVLGKTVGALWTSLFIVTGAVTAVFALIERYASPSTLYRNWRPVDLPRVNEKRRSRWDTASEFTAGAIFILWWAGAIRFPNFIPAHDGLNISVDFAPVWQALWWPVLGVVAAKMLVNLLTLVRPGSRVVLSSLNIACAVAGLVVLALAVRAGHWVDVSAGGDPSFNQAKVEWAANLGVQIALVITAIVWTLEGLAEVRRLWRAVTPAQTSPGS
jgi:hypothetical protein